MVVSRSIATYFSGALDPQEAELANFGNFSPYLQSTPLLVQGPFLKTKVIQVSAGYGYNCAVTDNGELVSSHVTSFFVMNVNNIQ